MKNYGMVFCLLAVLLSPLSAKEEYDELVFGKKAYTVGINIFDGKNLTEENLFLTRNIPELLLQNFKKCDEHILFVQERTVLQDRLVSERIQNLNKSLQAKYVSRDALLFEKGNVRPQYRSLNREIRQLEKEIDFFNNYNPRDIDLPDSLPIEFQSLSDEQPLMDTDEWSRRNSSPGSADMLIHGTIEQYGDYLYISVFLYNSLMDEESLVYQDAVPVSDESLVVQEASESLFSSILGREWSRLKVTSSREDSFLYLDDKLIGIDWVDSPLFAPGEYTLEVNAPGFEPFQQPVVLEPYRSLSIDVELAPSIQDLISINSEPAGADVYIGSSWIGITPLFMPRPEKELLLMVSQEGFVSYKGKVGPLSEQRLHVELIPGEIDFEKVLEKKKKSFYNSLGFFSLSLVAPVMFWQLRNNSLYYSSYNSVHNTYANAYLGCFIGSLVVSAGLLTYMFVRLYQYIKAAEDTAR